MRALGWLLVCLLLGCRGSLAGEGSDGAGGGASSELARAPEAYQEAQRLEASWRERPSPSGLAAAVSAYQGVGSGPHVCDALLKVQMLPAEVTGDTAAARTAIERLASSPACADAARRALQSFPEEARIPDAPTTTRLVESAPEVAAGPLTVTKVERYGSKHSARIVVFVTQATEFELGELAATASLGPRLYVDIGGAEYSGEPAFEVGGLVQRVRLGAHPSGLRVVLDLQQRVYQRVFFLPEPPRLVIDVSRHPPRSGWQSEGGGGQLRRVVLDPGHGGHDPGAVGFSGLQEKDVALDVAHRAAPLIARELGVDTLLTRDDDEFVPLDERVAKANAFAADLFISIHCNASESIQSHGVMSFVLDASGDSLAATIAARENAASFAAMQTFADNVGAMVDSATVASSIHFAQLLQRSALASLSHDYEGVHDGGVRRAGFFVLAGARMPAVLFEVSFISNPTEEERLDTPRYRQKLADGVVNAIRAYRDGR